MPVFAWIFGVLLAAVSTAFLGGCQRHASPPDPHAEAKELFDSVCGKCHGSDGRGGVPAAEGLPAPRNFQDPAFQASRSDADLKQVIKAGKGPMPAFGSLLDEQQLTLLVSHIRGFNPKK